LFQGPDGGILYPLVIDGGMSEMPRDNPPEDFRQAGRSKFRQRLEMVGLAPPHVAPPGPPSSPPDAEVVFFRFRHAGPGPGLADVAARYGFAEGELDQALGVVPAGRERDLYLVLALAAARARVEPALDPAGDPATGFVLERGTLP
jgi:hypothetical protein